MNDGAMHGDGWIQPDDEELIESVISHEGGKEVIYRYLEQGTLEVSDKCYGPDTEFEDAEDFEDYCMENDLWPAYVDTEGYDTVGVGHLITGEEYYDPYVGVTDDDVFDQLADDIEEHLEAAKDLAEENGMDIAGNYVVQLFMTEMCFNIGKGGYSRFRNGLKKLASAVNGDGEFTYNDAADEHLDSHWANQVKSRAIHMTDTLRELDGQPD